RRATASTTAAARWTSAPRAARRWMRPSSTPTHARGCGIRPRASASRCRIRVATRRAIYTSPGTGVSDADPGEAARLRMRRCRHRLVVAHELAGLHACGARGVELLADVRQEQHLLGGQANLVDDSAIRRRLALAADTSVEVAGEQRRE